MNKNKIYLVDGVCGSGKTQSMIKYVAKWIQTGECFVIAQPTINLCNETAANFEAIGVSVKLITSETFPKQAHATYQKELYSGLKQPGKVIVTTHNTFLNTKISDMLRKHYHVFFDEIPQVDETFYINLKESHAQFLSNFEVRECDPVDNEVLRISVKPGCFTAVEAMLDAGIKGTDLLYTHKSLTGFMESLIADELHDGHRLNFVNKARWLLRESNQQQHIVHSLLKPNQFIGWKTCRIMGANADRSMMYQLWPSFNIEFKFDEEFNLKKDHDELKNRRINVHYYSARPWSKTTRDAGGPAAMKKLSEEVSAVFAGAPSLVVANNDVEDDLINVDNSTRISNICHGINIHSDKHNIAFFSALNDLPAHYSFLERWKGIDGASLKRAKGYETMYQAIMRTSLRNPTSIHPVNVIVPDIDAANFLAEMLPRVDIKPMSPVCDAWGKPASTRGRPRKEVTKSNAEMARESRERAAARKLAVAELAEKCVRKNTISRGNFPYIEFSYESSVFTKKSDLLTGRADSWDEIRDLFRAASDVRHKDKADNWLLNFVQFDELSDTKTKADIEAVYGIQLDFDGGLLSWSDASQLFSDIKHLTYNSFNNGKNGDCKYRIVVPFDRPVTAEIAEDLWECFAKRIESAGYYTGWDADKGKQSKPASGLDRSKKSANSFYYAPSQAGLKSHALSFFDERNWDKPLLNVMEAVESWIAPEKPEYADLPPVENALQALMNALKVKRGYADTEASREYLEKKKQRDVERAIDKWKVSQSQAGAGHRAVYFFALNLFNAGLNEYEVETTIQSNLVYAVNPGERRRELKTQIKSAKGKAKGNGAS